MKKSLITLLLTLGLLSSLLNVQAKVIFQNQNATQQKNQTSLKKIRIKGEDGKIWYLTEKDNLFGAQDEEGKEILPIDFNKVYYMCNGAKGLRYFSAYKDDYESIWSINGNIIIPSSKMYNSIYPYVVENRIGWTVSRNDKYGLIDSDGEEVIPPLYDYACLSSLLGPTFISIKKDGHRGLCDLNGKILIKPIYESCYLTDYAGETYLKTESPTGKKTSEKFNYSEATRYNYRFNNELKGNTFKDSYSSYIVVNGKAFYTMLDSINYMYYKLIDEDDRTIIPFSKGYNDIMGFYDDNFHGRCFKVKKGDLYGLVNSKGEEIAATEFQKIEYAGANLIKFKINDSWGLMRFDGTIVVPSNRGYTSIGKYMKSQKTFPYTMKGYKGECDVNGRQVSKIKVEDSQDWGDYWEEFLDYY